METAQQKLAASFAKQQGKNADAGAIPPAIISILMDLVTNLLQGCITPSNTAMNVLDTARTSPIIARLRIRQMMRKLNYADHPEREKMIEAIMDVSKDAKPDEADALLSEADFFV